LRKVRFGELPGHKSKPADDHMMALDDALDAFTRSFNNVMRDRELETLVSGGRYDRLRHDVLRRLVERGLSSSSAG